ncbi:MAG: hypothetical protein KAH38_12215 [Candidatus Hydrogenedentes bacterium]|nr:hypothetical protein [Candidatus Hydrogenedentota bacterium]
MNPDKQENLRCDIRNWFMVNRHWTIADIAVESRIPASVLTKWLCRDTKNLKGSEKKTGRRYIDLLDRWFRKINKN